MAIQAIFLDMDHTLCDTERADKLALTDFQEALRSEFQSNIAMEIGEYYLNVIYGKNRHLQGWQKGPKDSEIEYRAKLLEKTINDLTDIKLKWSELILYTNLFMDLRIKHFSFFPRAGDMLRELKHRYRLIVVSNGPLFSQEPKIKKVAMIEHVHEIILGGTLKYEKPHSSIFELACQKAKCKPSEAIHVGDKLETDIKGANDFGIKSVWVNPKNTFTEPIPTPNYTIANICELKQLLDDIF
ncbi:HAD family hydrolase [Desulfosediminicola flagellatus]|uniref:HAD family hydrolase n=1 Tax=Desulfosediminicola flagellatus TaxID=2569541 RepID=UPI0010AD8F3D|nr:HAD family hydrolase [Desulfosediminicola flagellatus]